MEWGALILLAGLGFTMIILEFLVIPGTGLVGVLGLLCLGASVYVGYRFLGVPTGHFIVLGIVAGGGVLTWYVLRMKTWEKLSLNSQIDSKVDGISPEIQVGDTGVTVGRLAPMGKVRIGADVVEAMSESGYIDTNREIEVVKIHTDKIIVKLKTERNG
ncbi:hypothetical protein [Odoribacter lunatus]|uniref:hypothetical protein n=1 Tax=Odoribacter lunatus TaxID=2941335 RepID=UPI002041591C|nr:hypothetical protein [Odoribacter lunatus]